MSKLQPRQFPAGNLPIGMTGMKFYNFFACFTSILAVVQAETRDFTSIDGKKIQGEVTGVSTTQAMIKRESDRKIFTIPLESLSITDREFLARWREENPEFKLSFDAKRQTENRDSSRKDSSNGSSKKRSSEVSFNVTVTNHGKSATPAAHMLFYSQVETNGEPGGLPRPYLKEDSPSKQGMKAAIELASECQGTLELPVIDPGKSVDLVTPSVTLVDSSSSKSNWTQEGTEQYHSNSRRTLKGISLIVHYREREVAAWTTPGSDRKLILFRDWLSLVEKVRKRDAERAKSGK